MTTIDHSVLDPFGVVLTTSTFDKDNALYDSITLKSTKDNLLDTFKSVCNNILDGRSCNLSLVYINQLVYTLVNNYVSDLNNAMFQVLTEHTQKIALHVQTTFDNNTFAIDDFVEIFKIYSSRTEKLRSVLTFYDENVKYEGHNSKKYSYINLMRNYLFYYNVINHKYVYDGVQKDFYDLLTHIFSTQTVNFTSLMPLFKIYQYFNRLSFAVGELRSIAFNTDTDDKFLSSLGDNQEFVKNLCMYLNSGLRSYRELSLGSNPDASLKIESVRETLMDMAKIVKSFDEDDMFINFYKYLMRQRLIEKTTDIQLEMDMINAYKSQHNEKKFLVLLMMCADAKESAENTHIYRRIKVNPISDKFQDVDIESLNRDRVDIMVFRDNIFPDLDEEVDAQTADNTNGISNMMNVPLDIISYPDIFKIFYKVKYENRLLNFSYNTSTAVVNAELNGKMYYIQMTFMQMCVFSLFTKKSKWSPLEISNDLNIKLPELETVINSFLNSSLLVRDDGDANDPCVNLYVNHNFSFEKSNKISIVQYMKKSVPKETNASKQLKLLDSVLKCMSDVGEPLTMDSIKLLVSSFDLPFETTDKDVETVMNMASIKGLVDKSDDTVPLYSIAQDSESEDSDSGDSDSEYDEDDLDEVLKPGVNSAPAPIQSKGLNTSGLCNEISRETDDSEEETDDSDDEIPDLE